MKVSRQEYYNIESRPTADWLSDHMVDEFLKKAVGVDYLKQYLDKFKNNKFSSIEEKMADIRERIGFDVSNRLREEVERLEKSAGSCSTNKKCDCNGRCGAKPQIKTARQQLVANMDEILKFITDMTHDRPNCMVAEVMDKLSETSKYNGMKANIDDEKLRAFVEEQIRENSNKKTDEPLHYVPDDGGFGDEYSAESNANEMWNHAQVGNII